MRIMFGELLFSAILLNGLHVYLSSLQTTYDDGGQVASLCFAGQNFIWLDRVI